MARMARRICPTPLSRLTLLALLTSLTVVAD